MIRQTSVELHWPRTRDADIKVLKDTESGVIFLAETIEVESHYGQKTIGKLDRSEVATRDGLQRLTRNDDDARRLAQTSELIRGKRVCDFGTGRGLFLDDALSLTTDVTGIEIRKDLRDLISDRLGARGQIAASLADTAGDFDLVTLFHVLEHIPDQLQILADVEKAMKPGGTLFIEVPHARDFLSEELAITEYRDFTYWSEHLVLHTQDSLRTYLAASGFTDIKVDYFQRYGYANHLHWQMERKPGGHAHFAHLSSEALDAAYRAHLATLGRTDTLIATARKPNKSCLGK
ncbi:class I SAM-dependent methyltransferase [Roseibium limicola]|uniref:Class I SAM-dependent methyltransferase n=1 Tax=Roseibium limicola TaxID=2816037 RepID=A0A939EPD3_9HYPH|nr:class I SAM-dependent methyltransferase [Roseibium limicola]MBO0346093.1 class I SAM-dependent methyltransferase [Roseibium limicola]